MDTNKPMALRLADKYEHEGFLSDHKFAQNQWCSHAAVELRRLHAENTLLQSGYDADRLEIESLQSRLIHANEQHRLWFARSQELEYQIDAVGAGGVEPLRKRAAAVSDEQVKAVFLANGFTIKEGLADLKPYVYQAARALLATATGLPAQADGFGSAEHWKEKAQYWAGVAHRLRQEALRGEPVDGIIAPQAQASAPIDADVQRDAERYRWLRKQHWNEAVLCVVAQPKNALNLGFDCPSLDRLDGFIDAASAAQGGM